MIPLSAHCRAGTSFQASNSSMWLKVSNKAMMESEAPSFDDGMDSLHEKSMAMDMDTVVSAQSHSFLEEQKAAMDQRMLAGELQTFALSFMTRREFESAEEIFRHLLYVRGKHDDNETVATLANIGKCCELTGRLQEAMSCYNEALQLKTHQELHHESPSVQLMLASILYDIGMIHSRFLFAGSPSERQSELAQKALKAFSLALKLRQDSLGEQHPAVASAQHNIGAVLTAAGMPGAAIDHYEKALATRRATLGHRHAEVASSLRHLATSHKALGNYQEAAGYLSEALEILRDIPCEGFLREVMIEMSHVKRAMIDLESPRK